MSGFASLQGLSYWGSTVLLIGSAAVRETCFNNQKNTQIWVVMSHQYAISAFIPRMSFCGESSGGVSKLFYVSQASRYLVKRTLLDFVKH